RLSDINGGVVARLVAKRRGEGVSNATVNRTVTEPLRRVINRAKLWGEHLPLIEWRKHMLPEPRERVRELRAGEEVALFAALRTVYHDVVRFALLSGCRLAECVGLTWADVHWGERLIWINGKGGKRASIPMPPALRELLWPLQGQHPTAVFTYAAEKGSRDIRKGSRQPITYEGLKTHWRRAKAAAGLSDYRFHDNRHTAGTRVLRASGNLKIVQRLLRHEDIATTAKYAHAMHNDVLAAMQAAAQPVPINVPTVADTEKLKAEG
ncbi:MAG: tyrosine-type recombinase/integrase, partial [Microvirga sp.]